MGLGSNEGVGKQVLVNLGNDGFKGTSGCCGVCGSVR